MARRKHKRRGPQGRERDDAQQVVGFFASDGINILCDGDACIIAGSASAGQQMLERGPARRQTVMAVRRTTFAEIWQGLQLGGAYAFDERAYAVFRPLANRAGVALAAEDFSDPGPTGLHFLRVQLLPASRPLLDFGLEGS